MRRFLSRPGRSLKNTTSKSRSSNSPAKHAIALEAAKSPFVNLLAVREQDKDKSWVAKLVKACQSGETRKFVQTEFKGSVLAGF